ncbi:MAG: pyridoxamine 5'-phosphate oxidase family protein [Sphingomonadales bacterium]
MTQLKKPFHPGEQHIQERLGIKEMLEPVAARFIRDHMPEEHRAFFALLPFLTIGGVDDEGHIWASILSGAPGFVNSPDAKTLDVNALPVEGDPLAPYLRPGADIGVLGLQLETRRRNRLSGTITETHDGGFRVKARQSFGNCPKYIQTREVFERQNSSAALASAPMASFDARAQAIIGEADTFFIASAYQPQGEDWSKGADVSHRGGKPGFVRLEDDRHFIFPDFTGNHFFNTLGNLILNPKAGFLFPDFKTGAVLTMTGEAKIIWDSPEMRAFKGAQRLVRFELSHAILIENALPFRFEFGSFSPVLERLGDWGP